MSRACTVPPAKIAGYLLHLRHEAGGLDAVSFPSHCITPDPADDVAAALADHPDRDAVEDVATDVRGTRYVVRCSVATPGNRTVWMVRSGDDHARLVTAYPA